MTRLPTPPLVRPTFTAISLFSGAVDGLGIAARVAGFNVTHHLEYDAWCCKVLRKNFPHSIVIEEDIHHVRTLPTADVVLGSPPCQGWSAAGRGAGINDPRNLWPDMLRLLEQSRPRCVLIENVPGGIAKGYIDYVCGGLESANYQPETLVFPACMVGAPHIRERVFILAYTDTFRRPQPQSQQEPGRHLNGINSSPERSGQTEFHATVSSGEDVQRPASQRSQTPDVIAERDVQGQSGIERDANRDVSNATSEGLHEPVQADRWQDSAQARRGMDNRPERSGTVRQPAGVRQPGLVGSDDGTADRMDSLTRTFPGFPNYLGLPPYAYEPPKTIPSKVPYHKERIAAAGNAVVWQQAYPLMRGIRRWLESQS